MPATTSCRRARRCARTTSNIKSFEVKKPSWKPPTGNPQGSRTVGTKLTPDLRGDPLGLRRRARYGSSPLAMRRKLATEAGFTVNRGQIVLDRPIKDLGSTPSRCNCTRKSRLKIS